MFEIETRTQPVPAGKDMNMSDRANEHSGRHTGSGPFSWYLAQPVLRQSRCVLTVNGYVLLP